MKSAAPDLADILTGRTDPTDAAKSRRLAGENLAPFSAWRFRLADALGLRFFRAIAAAGDDDRAKKDFRNGSYPGVESDSALVLWTMAHQRGQIGWAVDPFFRAGAFEAIDEWADKMGIYPGGDNYAATESALATLFEILDAMDADPDANTEKKTDQPETESSPTGPDTAPPSQKSTA